jgi:2,5-dihydroxypyridine 5,6-dioxygenase
LTGNQLATNVLKQADMVIDLMGLVHSPEQTEILGTGTRMLIFIETPDILARMMPSADAARARLCGRAGLLGPLAERIHFQVAERGLGAGSGSH